MLDLTNADTILGTGTWLRPDIMSSEIFPLPYTVYRKDRSDGYGGALITIENNEETQRTHKTESVYV